MGPDPRLSSFYGEENLCYRGLGRGVSMVLAMKRILSSFLFGLVFLAMAASVSLAQQSERRVVLSQDADYFGGDYDILKDVTIDACQAACLGDGQCQAFTYNVSAGWCFLKSSVGELRSVAGAISGAWNGIWGIPRSWVEQVEGSAEIRSVAGKLYKSSV